MSRTGSSEAVARTSIDEALAATGWVVQHFREINLKAGRGVAVREFPTSTGPADYLLFADGKAIGVVEAKKAGATLSGVAEQSLNYAQAVTPFAQRWAEVLPFTYESTGVETLFCDLRDPHARSRQVFSFHRPETLLAWVRQPDTLRARLQYLPPLITAGLRDCQIQALQGLERSLTENRPRALLQMATGSGKTFTAVTACYRLIKHAEAKRILFLVDRNNLGRQTLREFQQYVAPDDGRKFAACTIDFAQFIDTRRIKPPRRQTRAVWCVRAPSAHDTGYRPTRLRPSEHASRVWTNSCHGASVGGR